MLLISILFLLLSNAVIIKRDMSIVLNRIGVIFILYCILQDINSLSLIIKNVSIHNNLLYITNITQIFHIFIFIISIGILQLTCYYPINI